MRIRVVPDLLRARAVTYLYHDVTDDPTASGFQRKSALPYKHSVLEFATHVDVIAECGLTPRRVDAAVLGSPSDVLMLTFDDGGHSALTTADILERKGWHGHFFVSTEYIGSRSFMSARHIEDLHRRGHVVGSHSHSHPAIFRDLSLRAMTQEWQTSCSILSDIVQAPVVAASVPGGEMDRNTCSAAGDAGIAFLFTSEPTYRPWRVGSVTCVGRVCPLRGTSLRVVRGYAEFSGFRRAMAVRRTKAAGKRLLGPVYRWMAERKH